MNNQTLGTIAMICAPALLIEGLLVRGGENAAITGIASMVFMAGWICTNTGVGGIWSRRNRRRLWDERIESFGHGGHGLAR